MLLLLALGGGWLWYGASGLFPSNRTLTCSLEDMRAAEETRPLRQVEIQLWQEETLLFRFVRKDTHHRSWTEEVQLKPGRYGVWFFVSTFDEKAPAHVYKRFLNVDNRREFHLRF